MLDWDCVLVLPVQPGRQEEAAAPEALMCSSASPRTRPARSELFSPAGCSKLRYEMLSWSTGCEVSTGFPAALEERPPLGMAPCAAPGFSSPSEGSFTSLVQHWLRGHYTNCAHWFSLRLVFVN